MVQAGACQDRKGARGRRAQNAINEEVARGQKEEQKEEDGGRCNSG